MIDKVNTQKELMKHAISGISVKTNNEIYYWNSYKKTSPFYPSYNEVLITAIKWALEIGHSGINDIMKDFNKQIVMMDSVILNNR